jgi:dTMP kinase
MTNKKGRFVVVSGGEGSGKSTQVKRAEKFFGDRVLVTREPGGSPYAEEIRKVFLSETGQQADALVKLLLAFAARADHLHQKIRPALEAGKLVICDRFDADTFAYQIRAEDGGKYEEFFWQLREKVLGDTKPDLYLHFDLDPGEGLNRKLNQKVDPKKPEEQKNVYDSKPLLFHHKVNEGLKEFMKHRGIDGHPVDASPDPEKVWEDFKDIIEGQLHFLGR